MVWAYVDTVLGGLALLVLFIHIRWHSFWTRNDHRHHDDE
jgi:hypothetical protein